MTVAHRRYYRDGRGSLGRAIEEELRTTFLMYGDVEEVGQQLTEAAETDLIEEKYKTIGNFTERCGMLPFFPWNTE